MNKKRYLLLIILAVLLIVSLAFYNISAFIDEQTDFTISTINNEHKNTVVEFDNNEKGDNIDNIIIKYDGNPIYLGNILCQASKLYIPLNQFVKSAGGIVINDNDELSLSLKQNVIFNLKYGIYHNGEEKIKLSRFFIEDDNFYISVFDFCQAFSLFSDWDIKTKTISFFSGYQLEQSEKKKGSRQALIRLEDVAPTGDDAASDDDLLKQRVIADYLYSNNIPFGISVVPRYKDPPKGIDNDPSRHYTFYNAQFVFTLDYYIGRGGVIGAHGYTHQNRDGVSLYDAEFGKEANIGLEDAKNRIDLTVKAFEDMNISASFFSFPHYLSTPDEVKYVTKYFNCIYQTYKNKVTHMLQGVRLIKLVPTPINYVGTMEAADTLSDELKTYSKDHLMSIFFHPFLEYQHITIERDNRSKPVIKYDSNTIMHKIISAMQENGGEFVTIFDAR